MRIRGRITEDFVNYKQPGLFVPCCYCDFKCCHDLDTDHSMCQNSAISEVEPMMVDNEAILDAFKESLIAKVVIFGGLEPIWQIDEIEELLALFRDNGVNAPFVIYTGYNEDEVERFVERLLPYGNIVVKYGRYIPDDDPHYDAVLGVMLASSNQYAKEYNTNMEDMDAIF